MAATLLHVRKSLSDATIEYSRIYATIFLKSSNIYYILYFKYYYVYKYNIFYILYFIKIYILYFILYMYIKHIYIYICNIFYFLYVIKLFYILIQIYFPSLEKRRGKKGMKPDDYRIVVPH